MAFLSEKLYKLKRLGASLFTYDCASCGKAARGSCLCEKCLKELEEVPNYHNGYGFGFYYDGPARDAVLRYKFGEDCDFCFDTLCDWLMAAFEKLEEHDFDAVVPVPDFERRVTRLSRLAENFSYLAKIPFAPQMLEKVRQTEKQHKLSGDDRRKNLKDAFSATEFAKGKTVLLVDDIFTTGSTALECSKALYDAGAEKVCVITMLKTK